MSANEMEVFVVKENAGFIWVKVTVPKYWKHYSISYSTQQHQKHEVKPLTCSYKVTFIITKEEVFD